jgi:hypothetical protein
MVINRKPSSDSLRGSGKPLQCGKDIVVKGLGINYMKRKMQVQIKSQNSVKKTIHMLAFKGTTALFAVKEY